VSSGSAASQPANDHPSLSVQLSVKPDPLPAHPLTEPSAVTTPAVSERLDASQRSLSPASDRSANTVQTGAKRRLSSDSAGCDGQAAVTTSCKTNAGTAAIPPKRAPAFEAEGQCF
jgi:hypothetical protein